jgi:3-deoxy-D-manno-octulosonate 8-phosphate phosphatase (KDO 8-P phosphatase)
MKYQMGEAESRRRAAQIKLLILDVDGVLTNGGLLFDDNGRESKVFHAHDGYGIRLAQKGGIEVALLTGRSSQVVAHRAEDLGIQLVIQGSSDKLAAYEEILRRRQLADREVAYVGDDLVDIPVLRRVGLAVAVADATTPVQACCHMITAIGGGRGAVRAVCDFLLQAQGKWEEVTAPYLGEASARVAGPEI